MRVNTKVSPKKKENKSYIYKAASKLFLSHSFEDVTVRMICEEANVSIGTFYHYYPSKNDLLSIFSEHLDDFSREIQTTVDYTGCTAAEKIVRYFAAQSVLISTGDKVSETMSLLVIQIKNPEANMYSHARETYKHVVELLEECRKEGTLQQSYSIEFIADFIFSAYRGLLLDWRIQGRPYSLSERTEKYIAAILRMAATPGMSQE